MAFIGSSQRFGFGLLWVTLPPWLAERIREDCAEISEERRTALYGTEAQAESVRVLPDSDDRTYLQGLRSWRARSKFVARKPVSDSGRSRMRPRRWKSASTVVGASLESIGAVADHLLRVVEDLVDGKVPGLCVAVAHEGHVTFVRPAGVTSVIDGRSTTPDTAYLWFSMTKIATATAAVRLAENAALALEDPVSDYVPEFPRSKGGPPVTVRHLVNHTAGLANPVPVGWVHPASEAGPDPYQFAIDLLRRKPKVARQPGTRAAYSNLGYVVLGEVLTAVACRRYEDYVRDEILRPLGMTRTDFGYTGALATDLATGHQPRLHPLTPLLRFMVPAGVVGPSRGRWLTFNRFVVDGPAYGGLIGSGADAARFLAMHTGDGVLNGTRIVSPEGARTMRQLTAHGRKLDVGLGWFNRKSDRAFDMFVEHLGGGGGFWNMMRLYPRHKLGVLEMGNATSYDHQ